MTAIVLGGGLSGMAAANQMLECGGKVLLLDKSAFCGGNSTKATSGINGANTKTQRAQGIEDTVEIFSQDCLKGGAKKPDIVRVLCANSGPDVDWLCDVFGLDLSLVARLGGHSQPRTHRGKERFPGMTITYALIQMLEKIAEANPSMAKIVTKAKATELMTKNGTVTGVKYEKGGKIMEVEGPVIIATGGFGADFSSNSLLAKYRPDLMHLPTSNGEHCTGDGIKMGEAVGARTIDLEWVQVHPTGLVNPSDPDAKVKFLAAEALRGVGGLIFDAEGNRFCNELGRRDYVTGEMWKNKGPFRLCLNKAASDEIIWHCKHYTGRGVMKFFESGRALAKEIGCPVERMAEHHQQHYEAAKLQEKDPEGGPYPAYPTGKSWDKPSGATGIGKKFFHNVIEGKDFPDEPFYAAFITPIIHYCMGGLEITAEAEVLGGKAAKPIPGLYAAGEVMGGVHGNNRLGGNSLLDCVVFGRVAGKACAKYMGYNKNVDIRDLAGMGKVAEAPGAAAAAPAAGGAGAPGYYSLEDVAKHNTKEDCWVVLDGKVLDVTSFLPDHPGGELAILTFAGKDATEEFNMIHPPDVVGKYAPDAIIGQIGSAPVGGAAPAAGGPATMTTPLLKNAGDKEMDEHAWGDYKDEGWHENPGVFLINVAAWFRAGVDMAISFMVELVKTIFSVSNFKFTNDRTGLTRSAVFLMLFMVIHAVGNLHIFLGPDDFNGYGYFYVRLYPTGFGFNANIVEEYLALAALLHVMVAYKRTWDINRNYAINSGKLNLVMSGTLMLIFMLIHLQQFRFGATETYFLRPPPYFINFWGILQLRLFWTTDKSVEPIGVRDIYKLEFDLFQQPVWVVWYLFSVGMFLWHVNTGWAKLVPSTAFKIPKGHHARVIIIGYCIWAVVALCYVSFPLYCYFGSMKQGNLDQKYWWDHPKDRIIDMK